MAYQDKETKKTPGYTGFRPEEKEENETFIDPPDHFIPGYSAFVKGIKSENMYAHTFGMITQQSIENTYHKGADLPPDKKFVTTVQEEYVDQMKKGRDYHFSFKRLSTDDLGMAKSTLKTSFYQDTNYEPRPDDQTTDVTIAFEDTMKA